LLDQLRREGFTPRLLKARYAVPDRTRPGHRVLASTAARAFAVHRLLTAEVVDSSPALAESHTGL
jgi:hypothetical protein